MKTIQFIHPGRAILPELVAYKEYLEKHCDVNVVIDPRQRPSAEALLHWYIMGMAPLWNTTEAYRIHEFASLSTGCCPRLKNYIKRRFTGKPDYRIFLNEFVRDQMGFTDDVPMRLRDMGIWEGYFAVSASRGSGRWFYAGSVSVARGMQKFLAWWKRQPNAPELILCGPADDVLVTEYSKCSNIQFKGQVSRERVAEYASRCEFGLNLTSDSYPFTGQTSTKLLEYCAMKLKVVTTRSRWVETFSRKCGCKLAYVDVERMPTLDEVAACEFVVPDVTHYAWDRVLAEAGILEVVNSCLRSKGLIN